MWEEERVGGGEGEGPGAGPVGGGGGGAVSDKEGSAESPLESPA